MNNNKPIFANDLFRLSTTRRVRVAQWVR